MVRSSTLTKSPVLRDLQNRRSYFLNRQSLIFSGIFVICAVSVEEIDHRQILTQTNFIVVRIVRRGNFDDASSFIGLSPISVMRESLDSGLGG